VMGREELRHFGDLKTRNVSSYMRSTLRKLTFGQSRGIEDYLWPSARVRGFDLRDHGKKKAVIEELVAFVGGLPHFSGLPEIAGTVADEMIMNGMFDAPRDAEGK